MNLFKNSLAFSLTYRNNCRVVSHTFSKGKPMSDMSPVYCPPQSGNRNLIQCQNQGYISVPQAGFNSSPSI